MDQQQGNRGVLVEFVVKYHFTDEVDTFYLITRMAKTAMAAKLDVERSVWFADRLVVDKVYIQAWVGDGTDYIK